MNPHSLFEPIFGILNKKGPTVGKDEVLGDEVELEGVLIARV